MVCDAPLVFQKELLVLPVDGSKFHYGNASSHCCFFYFFFFQKNYHSIQVSDLKKEKLSNLKKGIKISIKTSTMTRVSSNFTLFFHIFDKIQAPFLLIIICNILSFARIFLALSLSSFSSFITTRPSLRVTIKG